MSQLLVGGLEDDVVDALQRAAAAHGRSAEDEHREILRNSLLPYPRNRTFKEALAEMPYFDDDELFDNR